MRDSQTISIGRQTELTTLTLAGLRDLVEQAILDYGEGSLVAFKADYGDYSHTQQVLPLDGTYDLVPVREETGYSRSDVAVYEGDEDGDFDGDRCDGSGLNCDGCPECNPDDTEDGNERPRVVIFN
jgi:hypothetical protein